MEHSASTALTRRCDRFAKIHFISLQVFPTTKFFAFIVQRHANKKIMGAYVLEKCATNDDAVGVAEKPKPLTIVASVLKCMFHHMFEQSIIRAHLVIQTSHHNHKVSLRKHLLSCIVLLIENLLVYSTLQPLQEELTKFNSEVVSLHIFSTILYADR